MSSETRPRLVMCRPDYFEVAYAINPWMDPDAWDIDSGELASRSRTEWDGLVRTFKGLGIEVELQTPAPGAPDLVFTANAAVVLDGKALLARFLDAERRVEEPHNENFYQGLREKGVLSEVKTLPEGMFQEGAGDCSWDVTRQLFWVGHGQRSRPEASRHIEEFFGRKTVPLELVDPRFYHVDTCLSVLTSGHIVYFPAAFSDDSIARLTQEAGGEEWLIAAGADDASTLAVNLVNTGKDIVMAACSAGLERRFNEIGYRVIRSPLTAFGMSGGAAFCLTLRLDHQTRAA